MKRILTERQVREIRKRWCLPKHQRPTQRELAEEYNTSSLCIWGVCANRTYKDKSYTPPKQTARGGKCGDYAYAIDKHIEAIRKEYWDSLSGETDSKVTYVSLAKKYGVSRSTIDKIINYKGRFAESA